MNPPNNVGPGTRGRRSILFWSRLILGLVVLAYFGLAVRLVKVQFIEHERLADQSREQMQATVRWTPWRGTIVDSTGRVLAMSYKVHSCAIDPMIVEQDGLGLDKTIDLLADALALEPAELQRIYERAVMPRVTEEGQPLLDEQGRPRMRRFIWVRRKLTDEEYARVSDAIEANNRAARESEDEDAAFARGITFPQEYKRRYPEESLMAHVLGFTDIDGMGREGVEAMADAFLRGLPDARAVERDARRRILAGDGAAVAPERNGLTMELTLDASFQLIAEDELGKAVEQYTPKSACALVMDPYTGSILALANYPTFNPNVPADVPAEHRLNIATATIMEPGSTFKPLVWASAFDQGLINLEDLFNCESGAWRMSNGRVLHDSHGYANLTAEGVLVKSSNIGMAKIAALLGPRGLYDTVRAFGFGRTSGIALAGEQAGMVWPFRRWTSYSMGSVPMGQEVAVTPVQLASAYCVLANGGTLLRPRFVNRLLDAQGNEVHRFPVVVRSEGIIRDDTAAVTRGVMRKVVTEGTGRRVEMDEYALAGKTGTAQLAVNAEEIAAGHRGYSPDRYVSTFVGIAPYDVPRLVVLCSVREPKGAYYGGVVAGPVVREISRRGLLYLGEPTRATEGTDLASRRTR